MITMPSRDKLIVETAANRLVLRAILSHLIFSDPKRAEETVHSLLGSVHEMADGSIKVHDMDPDLHAKAIALVTKRATAFLKDLKVGDMRPQKAA